MIETELIPPVLQLPVLIRLAGSECTLSMFYRILTKTGTTAIGFEKTAAAEAGGNTQKKKYLFHNIIISRLPAGSLSL
jgi:hypothetical protein